MHCSESYFLVSKHACHTTVVGPLIKNNYSYSWIWTDWAFYWPIWCGKRDRWFWNIEHKRACTLCSHFRNLRTLCMKYSLNYLRWEVIWQKTEAFSRNDLGTFCSIHTLGEYSHEWVFSLIKMPHATFKKISLHLMNSYLATFTSFP